MTEGAEITEEQLIARARVDRGAAEVLVLRHFDRLMRFIQKRMPLWLERHVDAEEVLQETFARILAQLESFHYRGEGSFHAWSATVASHHLMNLIEFHRAKKRDALNDVSLDAEDSSFAVALTYRLFRGQKSPSQIVANRELLDQVQACIDKLQEAQVQVILLRYIKGHSVRSTAGLMGRTERAVEQLTYRALRSLRRMLPKFSSWQN